MYSRTFNLLSYRRVHFCWPCLMCTFIAPKLFSLDNVHPLDQIENKTVVDIASCHRSCWKLFIINHSVLLIALTPGNRLIYPHFVHDVVDLDNKQVKVDSFDEHPAESCHQKILQKGRHGNTGILHNRMTGKSSSKDKRQNSRQF